MVQKNEDFSESVNSFDSGAIFPPSWGQELSRNVVGMSVYAFYRNPYRRMYSGKRAKIKIFMKFRLFAKMVENHENLDCIGGWEKRRNVPNRESKPSARHPHRTHDTTDQWRETVQWLGRFWRKVWLCGTPPRPTSIGFKHVFVDLSKENNGLSKDMEILWINMLTKPQEFKAFLNLW